MRNNKKKKKEPSQILNKKKKLLKNQEGNLALLKVKEEVPLLKENKITVPKIRLKIIGVGGGGSNIVSEIANNITGFKKISFLCANTDFQALKMVKKNCGIFPFGEKITRGLGAGMNPALGEKAALVDEERIEKLVKNTDLLILVSCLGGGTGSGSMPIFAQKAKKSGAQVLGFFTLPFKFEGEKRLRIAKESLLKIKPFISGFALIPNENVFQIADKKTPLRTAFSIINNFLSQALKDLIEILFSPGIINIDFSDLKTILAGEEKEMWLNSVSDFSEQRVEKIISQLFQNPLLGAYDKKPERVLLNISGSNLKVNEIRAIGEAVYQRNPRAKIILGISSPLNQKELKSTILALGGEEKEKSQEKKKSEEILVNEKPSKKETKNDLKKPEKKKKVKKEVIVKVVAEKEMNSSKREVLNTKNKELPKKVEPLSEKEILPTRKNALELHQELKKIEEEFLKEETKWDTPAFLRKKIKNF
jgi:cell division protein FtsZ